MSKKKVSPNQIANIDIRTFFEHFRWAFARLWSIRAPLLLAILFFTVVNSCFPAAVVLVARKMVNTVVQAINNNLEFRVVLPWLLLSLGLTLFQTLLSVLSRYVHLRFNEEVNLTITLEILTHASNLDIAVFEQPEFQNIMERVQQNTAQHLSQFVKTGLDILSHILQTLSLFGILLIIEPLLLVAIAPVIIPYGILHFRLARRKYEIQYLRSTKRRWSRYIITLLTKYQWVPETRVLDLAPYFLPRIRSLLIEFKSEDRKLKLQNIRANSLFTTVTNLIFYGIFARIIVRALQGDLSVGDVVVYGGASSKMRNLLNSTITLISTSYEHTCYVSDFRKFLAISSSHSTTDGVTPSPVTGDIELRNVTFRYPGSESRSAISEVSLRIESGEIVALVGENGAGKTTLAKVIAGLYPPASGTVLLDGVDVQQWNPAYLYSQVSFVFQQCICFEATAADNIAYGDWRRLLGQREEIEAIARRTNVHPLIEQMPCGYETQLGRLFSEYTPSVGQWQNLAVARAFARDAAVLILDEPTSNLDARAEYELFCRFRHLAKGRTTILISHRFSTVSMANRIIMLDEGQVVETGTHQELLGNNGAYSGLYRLHQQQMGN